MSSSGANLTLPKSYTEKLTDDIPILAAQIEKLYKAGFLPNSDNPIKMEKDDYRALILKSALKSTPEFLSKTPPGCLPFVLVLPRKFVNCKTQMELIKEAINGQVIFNDVKSTISIKTGEIDIIIQNVDFSTFRRMTSTSQPTQPYLLLKPLNLGILQEHIAEFSPEDILAIIFQCAA